MLLVLAEAVQTPEADGRLLPREIPAEVAEVESLHPLLAVVAAEALLPRQIVTTLLLDGMAYFWLVVSFSIQAIEKWKDVLDYCLDL